MLSAYTEGNVYHEVEIEFLIEVLSHTPSRPVIGYAWEDSRVCQALQAMKKEGINKGRLNIRRGKDEKGLELTRRDSWGKDGFFTSEWMSKAKKSYPSFPTLVLGYEKGEKSKGWDDQALYLPTLVFPKNKFVFMFNYSE